ncbi:MAG: sodium:alanine symporter family protein [bacterium]
MNADPTFYDSLLGVLNNIDSIAWGKPMIVMLIGTGIFMSVRLKFVQLRKMRHAVHVIMGKYDDPTHRGDISHFRALASALSATIGIGNIAGVATAIHLGGPGAVFWMWVTALFGMSLKYAGCMLSLKHRVFLSDGQASGGAMYYLTRGLGQKWLGVLFAVFTVIASFGIGNMTQANSVAIPLNTYLHVPRVATGIILAVLVAAVIIGGIKRIGAVAGAIVPFMALVYIGGALVILVANAEGILPGLKLIFANAFTGTAKVGGFTGAAVAQTIQFGVARGLFSNEAGLGSASMVHAAAKTEEPAREGLVAMMGPFIDTIIICTMTALVIVTTGQWQSGLTGSELSIAAFNAGVPQFGKFIVNFGLIFFAFSTIIAWSYYGDRGAIFLFGEKAVHAYRWLYVLAIPLGATLELDLVWTLSDICNALMALPNLIGIVAMSGVVVAVTNDYLKRTPMKPPPRRIRI